MLQYVRSKKAQWASDETPAGGQEGAPGALPGWADLRGGWGGWIEARGGGKGELAASFDLHGHEWEAGAHRLQKVHAAGEYNRKDGLRIDSIFIQKDDAATLHADGTLLGPSSNLHFAVLNFPASLVPTFMQAVHATSPAQAQALGHAPPTGVPLPPGVSPFPPDPLAPLSANEGSGFRVFNGATNARAGAGPNPQGAVLGAAAAGGSGNGNGSAAGVPPPPPAVSPAALRGTIHMEGDLRGSLSEPQCELQVSSRCTPPFSHTATVQCRTVQSSNCDIVAVTVKCRPVTVQLQHSPATVQ